MRSRYFPIGSISPNKSSTTKFPITIFLVLFLISSGLINLPFLISDCSRFIEKTNWEPKLSLDDILLDTINYWKSSKKIGYEISTLGGVNPL